jgi:hypothetical protein
VNKVHTITEARAVHHEREIDAALEILNATFNLGTRVNGSRVRLHELRGG